jgi:hypothetical protein
MSDAGNAPAIFDGAIIKLFLAIPATKFPLGQIAMTANVADRLDAIAVANALRCLAALRLHAVRAGRQIAGMLFDRRVARHFGQFRMNRIEINGPTLLSSSINCDRLYQKTT